MRMGQQACLPRTLENGHRFVLCSRSSHSGHQFHYSTDIHIQCLGEVSFWNLETMASRLPKIDAALSETVEGVSLYLIPVDSQLCAVRIRGSCKMIDRGPDRRNSLVISAYEHMNWNPNAIKHIFHRKLYDSDMNDNGMIL